MLFSIVLSLIGFSSPLVTAVTFITPAWSNSKGILGDYVAGSGVTAIAGPGRPMVDEKDRMCEQSGDRQTDKSRICKRFILRPSES